jgi:hypothetical protein
MRNIIFQAFEKENETRDNLPAMFLLLSPIATAKAHLKFINLSCQLLRSVLHMGKEGKFQKQWGFSMKSSEYKEEISKGFQLLIVAFASCLSLWILLVCSEKANPRILAGLQLFNSFLSSFTSLTSWMNLTPFETGHNQPINFSSNSEPSAQSESNFCSRSWNRLPDVKANHIINVFWVFFRVKHQSCERNSTIDQIYDRKKV